MVSQIPATAVERRGCTTIGCPGFSGYERLQAYVWRLGEGLREGRAEAERLRAALEWYADEARYLTRTNAPRRFYTEAEEDNGKRAREALGR